MTTPDRRLLLVHAHPDDESLNNGATMAKYVADGARVTLVTCTLGEMGEILVPELEHLAADRDDALGEHRAGELAAAMAELGVTDHRLLGGAGRFRDSGMKWDENGHATAADEIHDNAFWNADLLVAATELAAVIREVRPQVLVTYDDFGNYGHPDHVQAHRVAHYGADLAAARSYRPDLGEAWDVAKIYWVAMSASRFREGLRAIRATGDTTTFEGMDPDHLPPFAIEDEHLDAVIEAPEHVQAKLAAMKAHRSQITEDGMFFAGGMDMAAVVWGSEFYRLVKGARGPVGDSGLEEDLFAGL
ncbi:N-acetyl-1-D-myo-inositol-2-amino-2-deoxy-alpha-D-glucopyranoside deacetylase [Aeromicrobium sp. CFBP 8757]|uniref:N-acetyl-1-D-myo-inositol-2-amino-2-deoxy-alpha- D-glucopyranoside deacetylase n=1 Tax=Aeromicrobium sp. CFBP 8757 TaxID=2775288 RepID=UPI001784640D|nr:N-acetyl-1-D-myo-inositol-2-amino-2-deoxy-alpha-D-glucopyranoside deacetylase [Aeromicrobium sp. CFBP 8757]MBD8607853.1 N-acetyl-1-D-myo-inositol-2-amino-2-deoxy-alpha-D-glucopyranoside deacetylase [Aeromicrobium sp. CFBP 8757]